MIASMGPRSVERGKQNAARRKQNTWRCFNGAAFGWTRKADYKPWNVIYVDDKLLGFMAEVTDWVQSQGIPFVYDPSFDAADLAATLISQHDGPAVYVSGSHHARQLVESGRVAVLNEMYGDKQGKRVPIFYTWPDLVADVYTLYGKPIEINYEDYLCLVGTRGMLGAPGVGPVTARVLLSKYGTLEGIQEAWPDISIKGKKVGVLVREGLRSLFDRLSIVRNIMLLRRDVPIPEFDRTPPDLRKFSALWPRDANRNQGKTISKPPDGQKEGENDESITDNQEHQKDGRMFQSSRSRGRSSDIFDAKARTKAQGFNPLGVEAGRRTVTSRGHYGIRT
jgi:5'-3' exonuclease